MNHLNFDGKIEPIGTMERYVVSPYSAEGGNYYNVDSASEVELAKFKKVHADAVSLVSASRTNLTNTISARDIARNKANECQAKRDAKSSGASKNNACDIRVNTSLHQQWGTAEGYVVVATTRLNNDIKTLDSAKKELDIALENEIKQSKSSPTVIIALNQAQKNAEIETIKATKDAEIVLAKTNIEGTQTLAKIKNKKTIILLVAGLLIVGGIVAYIKFKK